MASVIDVCNLALSHLGDGAQVISISPGDGSVQAAYCARFYPIARDVVLSAFDWSFATKRAAIAEVVNPSPDDWLYAYALPATCLRPLSALYPGVPWRNFGAGSDTGTFPFVIEAAADGTPVMYTNLQTAVLRYIYGVTDTTRFPPLVVIAISRLLASYLAGPIIKGDTGVKVAMGQLKIFVELELPKACAADAKMGRRDLSQYRAPWIEVRGYQLYNHPINPIGG